MRKSLYRWLFSICLLSGLISFTQTQDATSISVENVEQLQILDRVNLPSINQLSWSRDESYVAVATDEGVWLYDVADGSTVKIGEMEQADRVSFLGDSTRLAVNYGDRAVIFDRGTSKLVRELPGRFDAVSHNDELYARIEAETISLFSIVDDQLVSQIPIHVLQSCEYLCMVQDVAFSEDDQFLVFSSAAPEVENGIVDIKTGDRLSSVDLGIFGLAFNRDGAIIASLAAVPGYLSKSVEFTDSKTGKQITSLQLTGALSPPTFSRDNRLMAVSGLDDQAPNPDEASGKVYFFDLAQLWNSQKPDTELALRTETFGTHIISAQFSPSSRYLALGSEGGQLYIWGLPPEQDTG